MYRFLTLVLGVWLCASLGAPVSAEDPPKKLAPEERKELEVKWKELHAAGDQAYRERKYADAIDSFEKGVKVARQLYNAVEFPDGHENLALSLNNLAFLYLSQGRYGDAEPLYKEALAMYKRLYKDKDHTHLAVSLSNLANLYKDQVRYGDAEPLYKDALEMYRRLFKDKDHPHLVLSLNNLADMYRSQSRYGDAEPLYKDALAMNKRLYKDKDHHDLVLSLNNLASLYQDQVRYGDAEPLFKDALAMYRRLFKDQDHPDLARSLNNLAVLYQSQGRYADAEPLLKDALEMTRRLFKEKDHPVLAISLHNLASLYQDQGRYADAEPLFKDALAMHRRLFKDQDHTHLATNLNKLASLYRSQSRYGDAEPLYKDALAMNKRLYKDKDHPELATSLNNLASLYLFQVRYVDAEPLFKDALAMTKRLFKDQDHPDLARSLNNLAELYRSQGRYVDAEPLFKDALAMRQRLHKDQDHHELAISLSNLASLYQNQGRYGDAEPLCKDALAMYRRLFKDKDHTHLAVSLNNLAELYKSQGRYADAEPLFKDALKMYRRLFKDKDHHDLALSLNNLAFLYKDQVRYGDAEPLFKDALAMYRRLAVDFAQDKTEGETLTLLARRPQTRDAFLSLAQDRAANAAGVYAEVWADKGYVARTYERRHWQARAAATDPRAATVLAELTDARRRRAELLLAPATADPATLKKREADIKAYSERVEDKARELKGLLPISARADKLAAALPAELQKVLPADAAVVDFLHFVHFAQDKDKPGLAGEKRTARYLAFVVTREKVAWVDLGTEAAIKPAVLAWREAITSGKAIPAAVPAKVRALVWEKVRTELPAGIRTVYICPDADLCKVPFAALPGDAPGTIVLEEFAVAVIPHAPFLLDQLWPQDPVKNSLEGVLVVGGVNYDAELTPPAPNPGAGALRGEPLVKPGAKLGWAALGNTVGEANGVVGAAEHKKLAAKRLDGDKATAAAVLSALPKARYAHFATHGFFADASFRGPFQLDEKDFERRGGERVGKAVQSPLVMTGLVFAGANNPKTPGRGILTGEQLIDLDLSGLELAVLSACETGLGDVAGGEGTFGLQRAFHYAGTRNVVCSLWKVPDAPTAALMNLFYRNLWTQNLAPMEALRQAQLELYKHPDRIAELAKGFRGKFEEVPGASPEVEVKSVGGKAHPLLWAAFTLSGPGR
jgi:CHAT domain-containing protein/tetratricopeptide (TPR) repeat protein